MRTACDQIARKVQAALHAPFLVAGTELHTSASIGISVFPVDATDAEGMLKNGDIAMYKVKESGRDGYQLYASDGHDRVAQLSMAGRLRGAVGRGEMVLHYQPLVELETGSVVGVEALVRWNDPARGMVPPKEFIPLAERTGVIGPLSDWVIEEACRQGAEWRAQGLDLYVSVEHAAGAVAADRHAPRPEDDRAVRPARRPGHDRDHRVGGDGRRGPRRADPDRAPRARPAARDRRLRHGALLALAALQMMVTTLKIDRSFVHDLPGDPSATVLVSAIIQLAHKLGLQPLAEGIETEAQRDFLLAEGCTFGQGFLSRRPCRRRGRAARAQPHAARCVERLWLGQPRVDVVPEVCSVTWMDLVHPVARSRWVDQVQPRARVLFRDAVVCARHQTRADTVGMMRSRWLDR